MAAQKLHNAQSAIRTFVEEELTEHFVRANFCQRFGIRVVAIGERSAGRRGPRAGKCRRSLKRFENWRFKPWGAHVEIKRALNIVVAPKCVLMWGRTVATCRIGTSANIGKSRRGSGGSPAPGFEHDSQDSIRMRWKKNRKSRLGLGLEAEAKRRRASTSRASSIKSAGEAVRALLGSACARRRSRLQNKTGRVGACFLLLRRKAAEAAAT